MMKILLTSFLIAAFSLVAPFTAQAQDDHNEMGVYTDADMSATSLELPPYTIAELFMVISNPYNEVENRLVEAVSGVEFSFVVQPSDIIVLSTTWPDEYLDFGLPNNHRVAFPNPVIVTDGSVWICMKMVLLMNANPVYIHLAPAVPSSIAGTMVIVDDDGSDFISLYPSSGSYDDPVFAFNGDVVATAQTTFDGLKALYH